MDKGEWGSGEELVTIIGIITNYELRITNEERRYERIKNLLLRSYLRSSFVIRNS